MLRFQLEHAVGTRNEYDIVDKNNSGFNTTVCTTTYTYGRMIVDALNKVETERVSA